MTQKQKILNVAVIVAALGYLVDIYDLVLFTIVRVKSLQSLGLSDLDIENKGMLLLNIQMVGMLLGGIFWGILGDKKGRLSVLFGSIVMYSIANILNGMVQTIDQYYILRFIAGFGLAGELGAGITLVAEIMTKENRGWGTTIVATVGVFGAVIAGLVFKISGGDWRLCYYIGGGLGFLLLFLRVFVFESVMFDKLKELDVKKGHFGLIFSNTNRLKKYIKCILIGLPTWFTIGITLGDFICGFLSQIFKTRRKVMLLFLSLSMFSFVWFYLIKDYTPMQYYIFFIWLGISVGFWAVMVTIAAESFGTNLRSTVTTTVPNFVRGALVVITILYKAFQSMGIAKMEAVLITGVIVAGISLIMAYRTEETYGKDLEYIEV